MRLGLVGIGAIARGQHIPVLERRSDIQLVAAASRSATVDGVANHQSVSQMLDARPAVDAVSLCVPPSVRTAMAREVIAAGRHVFLEKPPAMTVSDMRDLARRAQTAGVTLFASWHSRYAAGVPALKAALQTSRIRRVEVVWKENVREFHPRQTWIWEPGGFGVFDPGINAFYILTEVMPEPLFVTGATLATPKNCASPIAAQIDMRDGSGVPVHCDFDFDQRAAPTWDIVVATHDGLYRLSAGGQRLERDGTVLIDAPNEEYRRLYDRFVALVKAGESDMDGAPLELVADCFLMAAHAEAPPFSWDG